MPTRFSAACILARFDPARVTWSMRESAANNSEPHKKRTPPVTRPAALISENLGDGPCNPDAAQTRPFGNLRGKLNGWITFVSSLIIGLLERFNGYRTF